MQNDAELKAKAPLILAEIKKAQSILLHCHPAADPDSVGSALAMKFALEQMGKKVAVIEGDSHLSVGFKHFPGASQILPQTFLETDLSEFDLFIALDSAQLQMITRRGPVVFPPALKVIAIDHHRNNGMFGSINLVIPSYPANTVILYDLFKEWNIKLTPEIASNLFIGAYADTGGLKYPGVTVSTYRMATELVSLIPNVSDLVVKMENSNSAKFLAYEGMALDNTRTYFDGKFAVSAVSQKMLQSKEIPIVEVRTSEVSSFMLTVAEWQFVASAVEIGPNQTKFSLRSKDIEKYDVAKLASSMGGGGHRPAAGLILNEPLDQAIATVVAKAKEMYNL